MVRCKLDMLDWPDMDGYDWLMPVDRLGQVTFKYLYDRLGGLYINTPWLCLAVFVRQINLAPFTLLGRILRRA